MPATRPLWADPAAREPQRGWFERAPAPPRPAPEGGEEPPPRRNRARAALVAVIALAALAAAATLGAVLAHGDDDTAAKDANSGGALAAGRVSALFTAAAPGVVRVRSGDRSGTGFVLREGGTIVTTAHAVGGGGRPRVAFGDPDRPVPAELVGIDEASGLAVVTVDPVAAPRLRALPLGDSDAARVGDPVLAIGYPVGFDRNVTTGIVSGIGTQAAHAGGLDIDKALQTDARADAGGPLLNDKGLVVGLIARAPRTGAASAAIPATTIKEVVPQIEAGFGTKSAGAASGGSGATRTTAATRAYLGVRAVDATSGHGALIEDAIAGGPADSAGLQGTSSTGPGGGDTILAVETTRIGSAEDLTAAVAKHEPGDVVTLLVLRAGQKFNLDVTLGERP